MTADTGSPVRAPSAGQLAAVVAGNALEFYDFLTYAFFAAQIGRALFPSGRGSQLGLLLSLATFGVGFLTRPLGGIVIGALADRRGRKPAMLLSFLLMGLAILGLALTPPRSVIGPWAGVLAVVFRMVQGFALGGELGPSTAYLLEAAPPHRRGLYVSFQFATQNASVLVAGLVGLALSQALSPRALVDWGWRAAMLLGVAVLPFGMWLRSRLAETLPPARASVAKARSADMGLALAGLLLFGASTVDVYTLNYLTTYAQVTLHMGAGPAFGATVVLGLVSTLFAVASGRLSDRFGRRPVMIAPFALLVLLTIPAFALMAHARSPVALFCATAVLAALTALGNGPVLVLFAESAATHVRARSLSLVYAAAIALFGGTAQLLDAWLVRTTGDPLAPAWYMTAAMLVGLLTMLRMQETAPRAGPLAAPG